MRQEANVIIRYRRLAIIMQLYRLGDMSLLSAYLNFYFNFNDNGTRSNDIGSVYMSAGKWRKCGGKACEV